MSLAALILAASAGSQELVSVAQHRAIAVEAYAADADGFIDEGLRKEEAITGAAVITLGIAVECFADVNGDGMLNILDFVCYQAHFLDGCG